MLVHKGIYGSHALQVHIQDLCKVVKAALLQSTKHSCASDARLAGLLQDHSWGSLQWVNTMNAVDSMADKLMGHCALASSTVLLNTLRACFTEIFNKNPHPKVKRFTELQSVLADAVLPQYIARLMSGIQPKLQRMADITIAGLYSSWNPETKARIKNLDGTLQGCVLSHFVGAIGIIKQQPSGFQLPQDFVLVEDIDVQQQRKALCDEIARLNFATMNISLHVM